MNNSNLCSVKEDILNKKKVRAISQIFLLVLGIIAFGFIFGSEVKIVSADTPCLFFGCNPFLKQFVSPVPTPSMIKIPTSGLINKRLIGNGAKKLGIFTKFMKTGTGSILGAAMYAQMGASISKLVYSLLGVNIRNLNNAKKIGTYVTIAALTGVAAAVVAHSVGLYSIAAGESVLSSLSIGSLSGGPLIFLGVFAVTAVITAIVHKNFSQEIFSYQTTLWQPVLKGEECTKCNSDYSEYGGCTEYQCKAYGAGCEITNIGTDHELCEWKNPNDMKEPIMTTLNILKDGYRYNPDTKIKIPDRGVNLNYNGNCLPSFEGIEFGIKTDEPAQCKIDTSRTYDYDSMAGLMQEGAVFVYNHTFSLPNTAFPSAYSINEAGYTIDEGNNYEFYIRCKDVNDNTSPYNFVINFCVDDGPDTTAPTISTNYINNAYIRSNQTEIDDLEVYTNEPAECRWDFLDKDYKNMENNMTDCSLDSGDYTFPNSYSYGCRANLTGIKNDEINTYYIRCKDKPLLSESSSEIRIENKESYILNLEGTNNLIIDQIILNTKKLVYSNDEGSIRGVKISDATNEIQVRIDTFTSQGAGKQGSARCSYSDNGTNYEFYNNQNYDYTNVNNDYWNLVSGNYDYNITCCDIADNCDTENINFEVESDTNPPQITRSYYENNNMKLITNEEAICTYSLGTCNYLVEDGLKMETIDNINHFTPWDEKESLYVKCKDIYGNYPEPNECSIIVHAQYQYNDTLGI